MKKTIEVVKKHKPIPLSYDIITLLYNKGKITKDDAFLFLQHGLIK